MKDCLVRKRESLLLTHSHIRRQSSLSNEDVLIYLVHSLKIQYCTQCIDTYWELQVYRDRRVRNWADWTPDSKMGNTENMKRSASNLFHFNRLRSWSHVTFTLKQHTLIQLIQHLFTKITGLILAKTLLFILSFDIMCITKWSESLYSHVIPVTSLTECSKFRNAKTGTGHWGNRKHHTWGLEAQGWKKRILLHYRDIFSANYFSYSVFLSQKSVISGCI